MPSRSPSIISLSSSEDDIEMANLDDIAVTPDPRLQSTMKHPPLDTLEDSGDESDQDDEGEMALLGSPRSPRGRERKWGSSSERWSQVKGIVIEVSLKLEELANFINLAY